MSEIIIVLIGLLFVGLGIWILLLRIEGFSDFIKPHNMSIGQINIDGNDDKSSAELLRARFNHHFRRSRASIPKETGFLEVVTFDSPDLFQPKSPIGELKEDMSIEVSGVNVTKIIRFVNNLVKPEQWIIEGDFQTHSDRALLALRLLRGQRLIRTWYLERTYTGNTEDAKSILLEQLIDDAVFQLVYDFSNSTKNDKDLYKWHSVVQVPTNFTSPTAVASYYEARGALARYYSYSDWKDLNRALECLQDLRGQMPDFEEGLQLLGMTLAEKRMDNEAINVYDQLILLLNEKNWDNFNNLQKCHLLSIYLLKATVTAKLDTWQATHEAIIQLIDLTQKLFSIDSYAISDNEEQAVYFELLAHTAIQLSYTYSIYFSYMRNHMVAEVFSGNDVPPGLSITNEERQILEDTTTMPDKVKGIVFAKMKNIKKQYENWLIFGEIVAGMLENDDLDSILKEIRNVKNDNTKILRIINKVVDAHKDKINSNSEIETEPSALWWKFLDSDKSTRRKSEFKYKVHLTKGYTEYRLAEWENELAGTVDTTIFGATFKTRLENASKELNKADAAHPNHYFVLQFLGMVYSEPRRQTNDLNIAEQYVERAIRANPSDYVSHELYAEILLRRAVNRGVGVASRDLIEKGFLESRTAVKLREISGSAHLLQAEFQAMRIEIENDESNRNKLHVDLEQYINQAMRFLPKVYSQQDPDIAWLKIVSDVRHLSEKVHMINSKQVTESDKWFDSSKGELKDSIDRLLNRYEVIKSRWVARQRTYHIQALTNRLILLKGEIEKASFDNWNGIYINFR